MRFLKRRAAAGVLVLLKHVGDRRPILGSIGSLGVFCCLCALALASAGVLAAAPARVRPPIAAAAGVVSVAGHPALRFRTTLGAVPPDQRAEIVAYRLDEQLALGVPPRSILPRKIGPVVDVLFGEMLLFTVTREEAAAQQSLPESLAALWAHRLRALLTAPLLTVSATRVVVPLGETRQVSFGGLLRMPQSVAGGASVVAATLDAGQGRAILRGVKSGDARVLFSYGSLSLAVDVVVRPYAGQIAAGAEGMVTGTPAPRSLIRRMAVAAAREALVLQPGGRAQAEQPDVPRGLLPGRYTRVSVPVRITAPGCLPMAGRVVVAVSNQRLPQAEAPRLFYSNEPERVDRYGTLFLGRLGAERPARLLYHHQNSLGRRFALTVDVINPGETPVHLHVTEGRAPEAPDPIKAGHYAGREFLRNQRAGIGYITTLPARSLVTVVQYVLAPWEVASGLFALRQLDGSVGCFVQVKADDAHSPFVRPADDTHDLSPTIFGPAIKPLAAVYEVGGRWTFIRVGSRQQSGPSRLSEEGFGDYGVTYDIAVTLSNPTNAPQKVGLVFEAASGSARGLFVVDGKMVETATVDAHHEVVIATYMLPPGGMRNVRVSTLPLSGSAYPARLVLRDLPWQAAIRPGHVLRPH